MCLWAMLINNGTERGQQGDSIEDNQKAIFGYREVLNDTWAL